VSSAPEEPRRRTTVIVPPALEERLGIKEPEPAPGGRQLAGVSADHF
jgi:hypothetical protein